MSFSYVLEEWLATSEIEESTRKGYVGYIERTIRPALGDVAVDAITSEALERFYVQLRRCRQRCAAVTGTRRTSSPDTEHHCTPLSASTVRQVHAVISGSLDAAVRWEWITANPARPARKPHQKPARPDPPSAPRRGFRAARFL